RRSAIHALSFPDPAPTEISTLSLHDALPILPFRPIPRAAAGPFCALYQPFFFVTGLQVLPLDFSYFHGMLYKAGTGGQTPAPARQQHVARRGCPVVSALSLIQNS